MYRRLTPLLFRLDPERAHGLVLALLRLPFAGALLRAGFSAPPGNEIEAFGVRFRNRVGLAAGYDKNGIAVSGLAALGFGHLELGTVTRSPQRGNPRPRIHRDVENQAIVNSMGFPNAGAARLLRRLLRRPTSRGAVRLGINIGKSRETPIERAADDYCELIRRFAPVADYLALNLSSPNTLGLRELQGGGHVEQLLRQVGETRDRLPRRCPLLLKLAPDLDEGQIENLVAAAHASDIDGLIATNTTVRREGLGELYRDLPGGVSGAPLRQSAMRVLGLLARLTHLPLIGVGGILTAADARARLDAGATLVQLYTGLIYSGPGLVRSLLAEQSGSAPT